MKTLERMKVIKPETYKRDEIETSRLFQQTYWEQMRYVPDRKSYYIYDGQIWKKDVEDLIVHKNAKEFVKTLIEYFTNVVESEDAVRYYKKYQSYQNRKKLIQDTRSVAPLSYHEFDRSPVFLNCKNGMVNLLTGDFQPHDPLDYCTKMAEVDYNPDAGSETFDAFMDSIMEGDQEKKTFLQKCTGYSISGTTFFEKFFIIYGKSTRNGKGTFIHVLQRMLGSYAMNASADTFESKYYQRGNAAPSEDLARLAGSRFVSVAEPDEGMVLNSALVKALSGNDWITARYMYENSFEFIASFKIWFNTNHLPQITDDSVFKSDRVIIVPFEHHYIPAEQDPGLKAKLTKPEVLSAVLNWCMEGFQKVCEEGQLRIPDRIRNAVEDYRIENDRIEEFLNDCYVRDMEEKSRERISEAFQVYMKWCNGNNYRAVNKKKFREKLSERTVVRIYNNQYHLVGWYQRTDLPEEFQ